MKKVPELRFKEFKDEWKEEKLGDIGNIIYGKGLTSDNYDNNGDSLIIGTGGIIAKSYSFIDKGETIIIPRKGTISRVFYFKKNQKFWTIDTTFYLKLSESISYKFIYFYFKKINLEFLNESTGVPSLNINNLKKILFFLPSSTEQQKIALFLSSIDKKIELTDKKLEFLEKYKKGLMQKLLTGKVRFSGFSVGWKEEKLKNIAKIYQPQTISKSKLNDNYNYLVYGANGIIGKYNKYNHEKEQILVSCRGANCGIVNFSCPFCWITGNTMVINTDDNRNIDKNFLYFYLKNDKLNYLITGSGQPQITSNIGLHKINLPSLPEQQKIASFLSAIDKKIELIKSRLENLKGYKKGLLQKMFV